jgi:glycosyltransferase involved in cell wall biosynthesis
VTATKLLFLSTRFLFPTDSGGKIRTTQVLRGLREGPFEITLLSPAPPDWRQRYGGDVDRVAHHFLPWPEPKATLARRVLRIAQLFAPLPMPVLSDRYASARGAVEKALADVEPDILVVDFPHAAALLPSTVRAATVLFTHNVECEIFARHAAVAKDPLRRAVWKSQYRKMWRYERDTLRRFDGVVAVSERDRRFFLEQYGVENVGVIPTGVDLDFFAYREPPRGTEIVFTGSMDWLANQDGVMFFMDEVWPLVARRMPAARMNVVGRAPPAALLQAAAARGLSWSFSGFVDDVREHIHRASVYVIPLRVGGGTRLKAYEAMASGCPVVSTTIGVEGLPVVAGTHYLCADTAVEIADAICALLENRELAVQIASDARALMERSFSYRGAADAFAGICAQTYDARRSRPD